MCGYSEVSPIMIFARFLRRFGPQREFYLPWRSYHTFHHLGNNRIYFIISMSPPPTSVVKPSRNLRSRALSLPPRRWGVNLPDIPTASAHPLPLPRDGAITPDHRKRPTASTTAASTFTTVAGRNTTPYNRATVAPSASPPSQNTFALLDAADEPHALAAGTVATGTFFDTAEVDADDQTEGTAREDGDSQPLLDLDAILALDATTDPIITTLAAHDRVLTSTIAGVTDADRALDLAITGVATTLDDDDEDVTDNNCRGHRS